MAIGTVAVFARDCRGRELRAIRVEDGRHARWEVYRGSNYLGAHRLLRKARIHVRCALAQTELDVNGL